MSHSTLICSREAKRGQVILPTYRPQPYSALDEDSIARSRPGYRHPPLPHPPGTEVRGIAFVPKPPPGVVQPAANSSRPHPPNHTAHGNIRRHMRQLRGLFKDPEFGRDARYEHRELRKLLLPSVRGASTSRSSRYAALGPQMCDRVASLRKSRAVRRPRRVRRNLSPSARIDAKTRSHTPPLLVSTRLFYWCNGRRVLHGFVYALRE